MAEIREVGRDRIVLIEERRALGTAIKTPHGWKVKCRNGSNPWTIQNHVIKAKIGQPTNLKRVDTKRDARRALLECTS